ncbi:hypothetical protein SLE2022_094610 [Rubroshorea leprosula]
MDPISAVSEELAEINGQISNIFRALSLIEEFDKEVKNMENRNDANTNRMLNEKKQSMIKELNSYVAMKKQ